MTLVIFFGLFSNINFANAEDFSKVTYDWSKASFSGGQSGVIGTKMYLSVPYKDSDGSNKTQKFKSSNIFGEGSEIDVTGSQTIPMYAPGGYVPPATLSTYGKVASATVYMINKADDEYSGPSDDNSKNIGTYYFITERFKDKDTLQLIKIHRKIPASDYNASTDFRFVEADGKTFSYYSPAKGSYEGPFGTFIKKANDSWLPTDLGTGGIWGEPSKLPAECQALRVDPISDDENDALREMMREIGVDEHSFKYSKERDLELYQLFYSDMDRSKTGWYPNKILDYGSFVSIANKSSSSTAETMIWLNDETHWQAIVSGVTKYFSNPLNLLGTAGGVYAVKGVGGKVIGGLKSKIWGAAKPAASTAADVAARFGGAAVTESASTAGTVGKFTVKRFGSAGPIAIVGLVAIMGVSMGIEGYKKTITEESYNNYFELIAADLYMRNRVLYHQCMVDNGVIGGGFSSEILEKDISSMTNAETVIDQLTADMESLNNGLDTTTKCAPSGLSQLNPMEWIRSSFCGLAQLFADAGTKMLKWAYSLLKESIGTEY